MLKVEVVEAKIVEQSGTSRAGKAYSILKQTCFVHLPGMPYPQETVVMLPKGQTMPYPVGVYALDPKGFYIGDYKELQFSVKLIPAASPAPAKA